MKSKFKIIHEYNTANISNVKMKIRVWICNVRRGKLMWLKTYIFIIKVEYYNLVSLNKNQVEKDDGL